MRYHIADVPFITQKPNWCGIASLSMVLGYWGLQFEQEELFDKIYGEIAEEERYSEKAHLGIDFLIRGVKLFAPNFKARLCNYRVHEEYATRFRDYSPQALLQKFIGKGIPVIVRLPKHYVVVVGYTTNATKDVFELHDPAKHRKEEMGTGRFNSLWKHYDPGLPYDSRFIMLAVSPN